MLTEEKKIKIFVFRFNNAMHVNVIRQLAKRGVEILYWGGSKNNWKKARGGEGEFPETIFHYDIDAVRAIPPDGIDTSSFRPVDKAILDALGRCESQTLAMMNTNDFSGSSLIKKQRLYYEYVKYWRGLLLHMKPDVVLFADIPHTPYQYVIYCIARLFRIRVLTLRDVLIPGRMLVFEDIEDYRSIREEYQKLKQEKKEWHQKNLNHDVEKYYTTQTDPAKDSRPFYTKEEYIRGLRDSTSLFKARAFFKSIVRPTLFKSLAANIRLFFHKKTLPDLEGFTHPWFIFKWKNYQWQKMKDSFKNEHAHVRRDPDYSKKFIYVPLSNQPECSTSAMGGIFSDQILMIDMLASVLPPDWELYVKENPLQWVAFRAHTGRFKGYYHDIVARRNVRLVPTTISTYELINHSQAIATVTSTAGWEALLRKKPVLLFGHVFYMNCDGVFQISDRESCEKALHEIKNGYRPKEGEILRFLKAVEKSTFHGFSNSRYKAGQGLKMSDEENVKNIADAFYKKLTNAN